MPQQPPELAGAQGGSGRWWRSSAASFCFPGALRLPRAAGIALASPPNLVPLGRTEPECVRAGRWEEVGDAVSRWAAALPRQEGGDGRCCVLAGAVPAHRLAGTARSEQPRCNISNELGRLSCGCTSLGDVRAVYEVLCVCQRRECPPGSSGLQQEVLGYGVAVPPCEAQAMLVVGAVRQDRGMGLDCREMSCWARIIRPGSFLPRLREVIRICKSALCSVLWKCEPICCFP